MLEKSLVMLLIHAQRLKKLLNNAKKKVVFQLFIQFMDRRQEYVKIIRMTFKNNSKKWTDYSWLMHVKEDLICNGSMHKSIRMPSCLLQGPSFLEVLHFLEQFWFHPLLWICLSKIKTIPKSPKVWIHLWERRRYQSNSRNGGINWKTIRIRALLSDGLQDWQKLN